MNWSRRDFLKARILFVLSGCTHCRVYSEFIERINMKLPLSKQIKIIDCTKYNQFGLIDDPIIKIFSKYIEGYPALFLDGLKIEGAESRDEIESFLMGRLHEDLEIPEDNPFLFTKDCQIMRHKVLKDQLICN